MADGSYVVEGEYLVTVERLTSTDIRKQQNAAPVGGGGERSGRKPLRSASLSSDEEKEKDKKAKRTGSFIRRLRNSFKCKDRPEMSTKENSHSIGSRSESDRDIPIQELSRSLVGSHGENTADEVEDLERDVILELSLGKPSPPLRAAVQKEPSPTPSQCGKELDELIRNIESGEYLSPTTSHNPASRISHLNSSSSTSTTKHSTPDPAFDANLHLSVNSYNSSSKHSIPPSVSGLDIPLPYEFQKSQNSPEYQMIEKSEASNNTFNPKPQINVDIIMLPRAKDLETASEQSESVHYEKISIHTVQPVTTDVNKNENDLNDVKPDSSKPKLSFLNKLKKSFKACSSDKSKPNIPQLSRPPSTYIGSQNSLNGSIHSSMHGSIHGSVNKPQTPILELLSRNPEMCSQDSLNRINSSMRSPPPDISPSSVGQVRAVMSDPDIPRSSGTGRSRSLTEVSPIPVNDDVDLDASLAAHSPIEYANDEDLRLQYNSSPGGRTPIAPQPDLEADRPEKKRISFVGRLKRRFSLGKGDKAAKKKEMSKSTPVLSQAAQQPPPSRIRGAKSTENMSISSATTTTDVRTQIVLKSAKINKGCRCQVCTLVRRNIRSHCGAGGDPNSHHKYEVVLKMNLLGADFLNSECASLASYQSYEVPALSSSCAGAAVEEDGGSVNSVHQRTKTRSQIEAIAQDFQQETTSLSSSHDSLNTDRDVSELHDLMSSPRHSISKQSAV